MRYSLRQVLKRGKVKAFNQYHQPNISDKNLTQPLQN